MHSLGIVALTRVDIASYLAALLDVYLLLLLAYVLIGWLPALGVAIPWSGLLGTIVKFLADVSEPYLRQIRRFVPPIGAFDFSPLIGLLLLRFVGGFVIRLING